MPVVLGVLPGAFMGARILLRARSRTLRLIFVAAIAVLGIEMIYNGFARRF
jgi:uncharacterized membrane protein YfcA